MMTVQKRITFAMQNSSPEMYVLQRQAGWRDRWASRYRFCRVGWPWHLTAFRLHSNAVGQGLLPHVRSVRKMNCFLRFMRLKRN